MKKVLQDASSSKHKKLPPVSQQMIDDYAAASGDFNPIHVDAEAARTHGLPGTIVHGMLTMGWISSLFADEVSDGFYMKKLETTFLAKVYTGDQLIMEAVSAHDLEWEIRVTNQLGNKVAKGLVQLEHKKGGAHEH
ncbi:MaoC family dehydratase [Alteribacillus sp. HJP-4]|uniref:MaoC family dehydratase n=1 Tax=Alteribacillus sp. HJP-4 TaxID=2775394 RepID=UPI0035CD2188